MLVTIDFFNYWYDLYVANINDQIDCVDSSLEKVKDFFTYPLSGRTINTDVFFSGGIVGQDVVDNSVNGRTIIEATFQAVIYVRKLGGEPGILRDIFKYQQALFNVSCLAPPTPIVNMTGGRRINVVPPIPDRDKSAIAIALQITQTYGV